MSNLGDSIRQAAVLIAKGQAKAALSLLSALEVETAFDVDIALHKALAYRFLNEFKLAIVELDSVLAKDPYNFVAMMSKAVIIERSESARAAAQIYRNALRIAPEASALPVPMQQAAEHARQVVEADALQLKKLLWDRLQLDDSRGRDQGNSDQLKETIDNYLGLKKIYRSEPVDLEVSRLPAIPFYDRSHFPWLEQLEAHASAILEELVAFLERGKADFRPYVDFPAGVPVNQFQELNHSCKWSSLWLWRDGELQETAAPNFPATLRLMESLPLARQQGFGPTVLFSSLDAHTQIPPHTGSTNARLLVHLPLIVPGPARFRVANDVRRFEFGKAWVFDDTIEHEAWNESDEARLILIFDIWNPFLSADERRRISELLTICRSWYAR